MQLKPREKFAGIRFRPNPVPFDRTFLKRLVWLYFWLLILEGALRKWWLPEYSNPLLIVRDPVAVLIYIIAAQHRLMPRGPFIQSLWILVGSTVLLVLAQHAVGMAPPSVLAYGLRCAFLHLPLVFLLPEIFEAEDVQRMGKWFMLAAIPMGMLMAYQFRAEPDAWINRTVGTGGGLQLVTAMNRIRPPGTFSFISGPVAFFAIVTAFIGYGILKKEVYPRWLVYGSTVMTVLAVSVSGSRSVVLSVAIVLLSMLAAIGLTRQVAIGASRIFLVALFVIFTLGYVEHFEEGTEILEARFVEAHTIEVAQGGLVGRFLTQLLGPLRWVFDVPTLGHGLGVGTNVGAKFLTGEMGFLLVEGEWGRVLLEMGAIMGLAFITYRTALTIWLGRLSFRAAREGNSLALMLFGACALNVLNAQWGQPTTLGFSSLGAGLCLAALKNTDEKLLVPIQPDKMPWRRPRINDPKPATGLKPRFPAS